MLTCKFRRFPVVAGHGGSHLRYKKLERSEEQKRTTSFLYPELLADPFLLRLRSLILMQKNELAIKIKQRANKSTETHLLCCFVSCTSTAVMHVKGNPTLSDKLEIGEWSDIRLVQLSMPGMCDPEMT